MNDTPRVQLARLFEFERPNGDVVFSGFVGDARFRLVRTNERVVKGNARAIWSLTVEQAPRSTKAELVEAARAAPVPAVRPVPSSRTAPRVRPAPSTGAQRLKAAGDRREEKQAEALMRDAGIDPTKPMRNDDLPF